MSPNKNGLPCPKCKTETQDLFSVENGTEKIFCLVCGTEKGLLETGDTPKSACGARHKVAQV